MDCGVGREDQGPAMNEGIKVIALIVLLIWMGFALSSLTDIKSELREIKAAIASQQARP